MGSGIDDDDFTADSHFEETSNGINEPSIHSKTPETARTPPNAQQTVSYFYLYSYKYRFNFT